MISIFRNVGIAALLMSLAGPVYAQVCMEKSGSSSGKANMTCDMTYRNTLVTCDAKLDPSDAKCQANPPDPQCTTGTRPACPKKPMPMIDTPNKSFIADYTPFLWTFPRDKDDPSKPYDGPYALGTPGDTSRTFQIFGNTAPDTKRLASCTAQIRVPTDPTTNGDWAKLIRLQVDNCTNQYLVRAAMYPVQKEATKLLSMDDPAHPSKVLNLAGECQPLNNFSEGENEYDAGHYLEIAWKKTMQDPKYRATTPGSLSCVQCRAGLQACDKEPHLPCQTTLDNPLPPPSPVPEVRLSSISKVHYENINDPTHPFSPRWDFLLNDRDYGNLDPGQLAVLSPSAVVINTALGIYMTSKTNSVYCAGVKNADSESNASKKDDATVRVDVLTFRKPPFEKALQKRTLYNSLCFENIPPNVRDLPSPTSMTIPEFLQMIATSWCYVIDGFYMAGTVPMIIAHNKHCWDCFGNGTAKVDDESKHPPCTTVYLGKDHDMVGVLGGGWNLFSIAPQCGANFPKICADLRRPYTSLNVLKMRYHHPNDPDDNDNKNVVLTNGAGEGMSFREYFSNHMPYPRMWDMNGVSLQNTQASDINSQPPTDTTGQWSTIVGIGREAAAKVASDAAGADANGDKPADVHKDERCLTGGWHGGPVDAASPPAAVSFGGVTVNVPDAMTSWTEMKLYEARTLRNVGMSCLGRYEKVEKPGSAENMMLLRSGGQWQELIVSKCEKDAHGTVKNCKPMTYKECDADADCKKGGSSSSAVYIKNINQQDIPQAWRGYLAAKDSANQFPTWPGDGSPSYDTGLDKAAPGDVILMPNGLKDDASSEMRGLAKMAFVIEARVPDSTNCASNNDCYVRVLEPDNGKWPDSCATTDTWGEMKTRYYYKKGMLPKKAEQEYKRISALGDCQETKLSHCEESAWDTLKIYHINKDTTRPGCQNHDKAIDCAHD